MTNHLIESISNIKIPVFGKPSAQYFLNAKAVLSDTENDVVIIGDDWKTDILGAKEVGYGTILVKSGKYCEGDELKCTPDSVIDNLLVLRP